MRKIATILAFAFLSSIPITAFAQSDNKIEVLVPWQEKNDDALKISIINKAGLSEEKIMIIKKVIESDKYYTENGQTFFEGWQYLGTLPNGKIVVKNSRGSDSQ
jgi:hypothetical protein